MSQEKSFGIVIFDLGSGDFAVYFVDEVLWSQITSIGEDAGDFDGMQEWAGYLTEGHSNKVERPEGCPDRQGAVLKTVFCQTFVTELFSEVQGRALGIVTFPA